ncbi:sugar phosphate isomerase/epimerase family protein [Lederbergia galactosidilytica]|uniref:Sugar phosphate isomerase n=1 Tax=Lederbergia galactosidilytica TaxID=217031 RepID=A0A0Q9XTD0_9BACI|nr:sugar phosphate isomerase/epimerase [Lederbergia galactosidilytica]KRG11772.1 sugar phosphate isomerase [Lederbergia galactosidilytica]KRG13233.1 sugar phosphate isomerase [Virgibacillus soli]MBP1915927.1 sugar phosphate isomerase/epimerase [Lederbergia galactosidilytica]OAK71224.1 sugar phosphate isomerase [Lederbergia galactosidilytica]
MSQIRIGTLVNGGDAVRILPQIIPHGFESFSLTFWQTTGSVDLSELAKQVKEIIAEKDIIISSLSVFGNPLTGEGNNADTLKSWERLIDIAPEFGTDLVTGFTGRMPGSIDQSIPRFAEVFGELTDRAKDKGVKIAFENCDMGGSWETGDWNIAHNPQAWEMMFNAVPKENIGLQWEPCHQMVSLIDPIPQLRKWIGKIFNVHGKDATIAWDIVKEYGIHGPKQFVWHRTPGFGDTNWTDIISILRQHGYKGSIDIEGFHDPVYSGDLEMTGQVHGLNYLKQCRGGDFVPNPV